MNLDAVSHDYNRCVCRQIGRCLVHCSTCHCGEEGRMVYVGGVERWRWLASAGLGDGQEER